MNETTTSASIAQVPTKLGSKPMRRNKKIKGSMKTFKQMFVEAEISTVIPTKLIGFKEDYIIVEIGKIYEIFNVDGDFIQYKVGKFKELDAIFKNSTVVEWEDYQEEYEKEHKKYYDNNDWDAEYVIVEPKGDLKKVIKEIEGRF